jgi:HKD family nuclease
VNECDNGRIRKVKLATWSLDVRPGLYESLVTVALQQEIDRLADPRLCSVVSVDSEDSHTAIAQFLEHMLASGLASFRGSESAERQKRLADRIIKTLTEELGDDWTDRLNLSSPLRRLLALHSTANDTPSRRPDTPLARSALLTGTKLDPSLGSQLRKEIATADRVDVLCSFIKWSGLRTIIDELRELVGRSSAEEPCIRIITTSYMGATDPKAVEELSRLPNTQIRVSYDTKRTRLHAKAYIFRRETGFGSAYVGSANLSHAALSEGLEWTTKISHFELPYLWEKITATFESYWQDDEFEAFVGDAPERLRQAISQEQQGGTTRLVAVQFKKDATGEGEVIVMFELVLAGDEIKELDQKHYRLVAASQITKDDLTTMANAK